MSTTEPIRPRTLAEALRGWGDAALGELLRRRPDLALPIPADTGQLAARATSNASAARAINRLDEFGVDLLESLSALPEPVRSIAAHCLAKDPAARPTARQLLTAIGAQPHTARPWPAEVHRRIDAEQAELSRLASQAASVPPGSLIIAGAANADVPTGFAHDPHVTPIKWLLVLLIIPLGAAIVISLLVLLPGILRGEGLLPKAAHSTEPAEQQRGH